MLARIRGAIDSQIAAEQAKARAGQSSPSPLSRSTSRARQASRAESSTASEAEKDPSEFEDSDAATPPAIGTPTRSGMPLSSESIIEDPLGALGTGGADGNANAAGGEVKVEDTQPTGAAATPKEAATGGKTTAAATAPSTSTLAANPDLPTEVRVKLRKLDKIESRYADLLRSYKIVHTRNELIEPFEKILRENTPCESIADPKSLVDYINSFSLRADMVKKELVRVSKERDEHKSTVQKSQVELEAKEKEISGLKKASHNASTQNSVSKERKSDDIFNFDDEHEDLASNLDGLKREVASLNAELEKAQEGKKVAEETVESMQRSVEDSQSELEGLKETGAAKDAEIRDLRKTIGNLTKDVKQLKENINTLSKEAEDSQRTAEEKLSETETKLKDLQHSSTNATAQTKQLNSAREELAETSQKLGEEIAVAAQLRKTAKCQEEKILILQKEAKANIDKLIKFEDSLSELDKLRSVKTEFERTVARLEGQLQDHKKIGTNMPANPLEIQLAGRAAGNTGGGGGGGKKKNKKKKKGKNATLAVQPEKPLVKESEIVEDEEPEPEDQSAYTSVTIIRDLQAQLETLRNEIAEKDSRISTLAAKLGDTESLKEEIESLRDNLVDVGQEHVEAREKLKEQSGKLKDATKDKEELESKVGRLEAQIHDLEQTGLSSSARSEEAYKELESGYAQLKQTASALETDVSAAQRLAASRYKDLMGLRDALEKTQPELTSLRAEKATLTATKNDLNRHLADLKRLERTERDLKADLLVLIKKMTDKDNELSSLKSKMNDETARRTKAEEDMRSVQQDLQKTEENLKQSQIWAEQTQGDLKRAHEEVDALKPRLADLRTLLKATQAERDDLKEELELKTAQLDSSQSLMNSMRDQTSELAMQTREAQEQHESIEEELAEAQRLLGERTREAETMRRLLSEVETRHEARTREMKERMETAFDERDKAEEEAATIGRRRAREIEELKDKVRETERSLRRAEEMQDLVEKEVGGLRDTKARLEETLERHRHELDDTKRAMSSMTSALDDTDNQVREIERQKSELRRRAEQIEAKYEKLQKQHMALQDEVRSVQTVRAKALDNEGRPSSRSSVDSSRSSAMSPKPGGHSVDLVYLKNVLLQFLELKDKNQQRHLVPALKMLLDLDSKEERKWLQVVQSR